MIFTELSEFTESWLNPQIVWLPGHLVACTLPVAVIKKSHHKLWLTKWIATLPDVLGEVY